MVFKLQSGHDFVTDGQTDDHGCIRSLIRPHQTDSSGRRILRSKIWSERNFIFSRNHSV